MHNTAYCLFIRQGDFYVYALTVASGHGPNHLPQRCDRSPFFTDELR